MVSIIRKHISSKICDILKSSNVGLVNISNDQNLVNKISHFIKVSQLDKSAKKFALFYINLNDLRDSNIINTNLDQNIRNKLENLKDGVIKSALFNDKILQIETDVELLKLNTISSIYTQAKSYGYVYDSQDLYPKKNDRKNVEWLSKQRNNERTIVEFSSPNIAKPLHAGHMRSTFIGNFLSNIHSNFGDHVTKINYLGDWGTQYGILAVGFNKYGSMEQLKVSPIKHLLEVYVKANQDESIKNEALEYFSQMELDNTEFKNMWKLFRDLSVDELIKTYEKMNIKFDVYEAESHYFRFAKEVIDKLTKQNICKKLEDNAVEVKFDCEIKNKVRNIKYIVQKSNGSTLYITRDLAALMERKKKYDFTKIIYVVDMSQKDHFLNLYQTMKIIEPNCVKDLSFEEFYVPFGRIKNMSTRQGKVELLGDIINEAKKVAIEAMDKTKIKKDVEDVEDTALTIGISHLIIKDFIAPRMRDYSFTWSDMLANENSAYSVQYAHARLCNLLDRCKNEIGIHPELNNVDLKLLNNDYELILIQYLAKYDEIVWESFMNYEPYLIVQYIFQLIRLINLSLSQNYVIHSEIELAKARLLMYHCCKQVLLNSMEVIGIKPLNKI